jgi:hypothetical protein
MHDGFNQLTFGIDDRVNIQYSGRQVVFEMKVIFIANTGKLHDSGADGFSKQAGNQIGFVTVCNSQKHFRTDDTGFFQHAGTAARPTNGLNIQEVGKPFQCFRSLVDNHDLLVFDSQPLGGMKSDLTGADNNDFQMDLLLNMD